MKSNISTYVRPVIINTNTETSRDREAGEGKNHFPELGAWRQETEAADMKPSLMETLNCSAWMFYSREELTSSFI
jgi:hypothetical protein